DVREVDVDAAVLHQAQQVGLGAGRHLPDATGLDGDVLRVDHAFEHGDGITRDLQDGGELSEGAVELDAGLAHHGDVGFAPELLGPAHVGVDDVGDEAVGV